MVSNLQALRAMSMQMESGIITDSVIFFDDNIIVKEMLYLEFEAILDHVVGIQEFKNRQIPAVFVQINSQLHVVGAVFFLIGFDSDGFADKTWNIPLRHLVDHAGRGPDLGAGPIKLSCRSQCSVSWHQRSLWDPDMESTVKTLDLISSVAKRNRLGIVEELPVKFSVGRDNLGNGDNLETNSKNEENLREALQLKFQTELKNQLTAQAEDHKLRVATMKSEAYDHIEKLHANYRSQLAKTSEALSTSQQMFTEEKHKNQQLKKTLDTQAEEYHKNREQFQQSILESQGLKKSELVALQEKFELELKASIDSATTELKERLDMREVELFYRDEQISRLHEDIIALRKEKQHLIDGGGDRVLKKLAESGITFVAYHPGADHLTIPIRDIAHYLESPLRYIAEKCNVNLELYQQWISHYELPVCNHKLEDGSVCAVPIEKVENPSYFIVGDSDCCDRHNTDQATITASHKMRETS